MSRTITVAAERGLALDLLLWREHGRLGNTSAMLAAALKANPSPAGPRPLVPLRASVILPDLPRGGAVPARRPVNLFDD